MVVNLGPQSHTAWQPRIVARDKETSLCTEHRGASQGAGLCAAEGLFCFMQHRGDQCSSWEVVFLSSPLPV